MNYQERKQAYEKELEELQLKYRIPDDDTEYNGTVGWFHQEKGYGFINTENGENIFAHYTRFDDGLKTLLENDKVVFQIKDGKRGLNAVNIRKHMK